MKDDSNSESLLDLDNAADINIDDVADLLQKNNGWPEIAILLQYRYSKQNRSPTVKTLQKYLDRKNQWNAIFGGKALVIGKDNQRIADMIDSELSPENLTCDGELPRSQVQARYNNLMKVAKELKAFDPNVTFYEV